MYPMLYSVLVMRRIAIPIALATLSPARKGRRDYAAKPVPLTATTRRKASFSKPQARWFDDKGRQEMNT
jgi:hypothetical protein